MASCMKYSRANVVSVLRHMQRHIQNPANKDIDQSRSHLNYSLTPRRELKPYDYFKKRLSEVHVRQQEGVHELCGWIVTKPTDLPESEEREFFEESYRFLADRYGGDKNVVCAEIHKDESGEAHLHFEFIPVTSYTPNENLIKVVQYLKEHPNETNVSEIARAIGVSRKTVRRYRNKSEADIKYEKISARDVINKHDLLTFHKDLQKHLDSCGLHANVYTGVTAANGGNKTVYKMKMEREHERERQRTYERNRTDRSVDRSEY